MQNAELRRLLEESVHDATNTRKVMAETVLAKQEEKVARCEQVQRDKVS